MSNEEGEPGQGAFPVQEFLYSFWHTVINLYPKKEQIWLACPENAPCWSGSRVWND